MYRKLPLSDGPRILKQTARKLVSPVTPVTTQIACESRRHSLFRRQSTQQQEQCAGSPRVKILYPKHSVYQARHRLAVPLYKACRGQTQRAGRLRAWRMRRCPRPPDRLGASETRIARDSDQHRLSRVCVKSPDDLDDTMLLFIASTLLTRNSRQHRQQHGTAYFR